MPETVQEFLVKATQKAAADLETALLRVPEDKRDWSAMDKARSAHDMFAECAILNGITADVIRDHHFPENFDFAAYEQSKTELSQDWPAMQAMLHAHTAKVAEAIHDAPDADLGIEVQMPWGAMTIGQIITYPHWNMSYHEGQINFIASMLGCLN